MANKPPKILDNFVCNDLVRYKKTNGIIIDILDGLKYKNGWIHKWIGFNQFEQIPTKIPNGFKKVKIKNAHLKCDNSKKKLPKNNNHYKKIQTKHKKEKSYFTHDNGGRPFLVYIAPNHVTIYKQPNNKYYIASDIKKNQKWSYTKFVRKIQYKKIWIGKSKNSMLINDLSLDGNTILLQKKKMEYVFIGNKIFKFNTYDDVIKKYYSPVANNDVPYPVAFGSKFAYFLFEERKVPLSVFEDVEKITKLNTYKFYYGHIGTKRLRNFSSPMIVDLLTKSASDNIDRLFR